jgi:hypothetical protein
MGEVDPDWDPRLPCVVLPDWSSRVPGVVPRVSELFAIELLLNKPPLHFVRIRSGGNAMGCPYRRPRCLSVQYQTEGQAEFEICNRKKTLKNRQCEPESAKTLPSEN